MAQTTINITINRPIEDVFAVLGDPESPPKWSAAVLEAKMTSAGPVGVGSTARAVGRFLGRRIASDLAITEFEPNRKFAYQTKSGPVPFGASMTFDRVPGGTRVSATYEAQPGGFFKLAEPLVMSMAKRQLQNDLTNLKDLMEAHAL